MNPPTRRQDLTARSLALLEKSAKLRGAASLLVARSRAERSEAMVLFAELKSPLGTPGPEFTS